jgi:hypothetical protein
MIDAKIASGQLPTESKERSSKLDVRKTDHDLGYAFMYSNLRNWLYKSTSKWKELPPRDSPDRDVFLADSWKLEPILAGAVYSMTAKMVALKWTCTGKKLQALRCAKMFSRAAHMGGYDWGGFISPVAEDFYSTNRGVFIETAKDGDPLYSPMVDLGHIDALCCGLTGNSRYPVIYQSEMVGQTLRFAPGEFIHFCSLPSPRERDLGSGFCAVDRAYRAAALLMGLHDYDDQKLDNLPPEGLAAISGLTMDEFQDALNMWMMKRREDDSLTFPQVLWLLGADPSAKITVNLTSFSQLPESFDRRTVVEQYINTIALDFGVDAREFWSISAGGLGTAGESEIQHLKAKGKGPGEFISTFERHINGELPDGVDFAFDTQDIEEDANFAAVTKAWIDAYFPLYNLPPKEDKGKASDANSNADVVAKAKGNPRPDKPNGQPSLPTSMLPKVDTGGPLGLNQGGQKQQAEQVLTKDQFLRLLADRGVLPDYLVNDDRIVIDDNEVHNQGYKSLSDDDDVIKMTWHNGVLKQERVYLGSFTSQKPSQVAPNSGAWIETQPIADVPEALLVEKEDMDFQSVQQALEYLKEKEQEIVAGARNIHGEPIPEQESVRGSRVNKKTLQDELKRWRDNPILAPYALSVDEENKLFGSLKPVAEVSVAKAYPDEDAKLIQVITPTDRMELAIKDLQNTVQQMALSASDNRANTVAERFMAALADRQQSVVKIEIPPITMVAPESKPPVITINMPEQKTPQVNIDMPEYKDYPTPTFTFSPKIDVPTPVVNVNVPPSQVTVENTVPVPEVTVNNNVVPPDIKIDNSVLLPEEGTETIVVHRDENGKIDSMTKV